MKCFIAANDKQYPVVLLRRMCPKDTDNYLSVFIWVRVHIQMNKDLANLRPKERFGGVITQSRWDVLCSLVQ